MSRSQVHIALGPERKKGNSGLRIRVTQYVMVFTRLERILIRMAQTQVLWRLTSAIGMSQPMWITMDAGMEEQL